MADKVFLHQHPEFKNLISIVADQLKIDPYLAEKDYWIMHCLFGLQQAGYDFQLKGGTSLSKGYQIIHRFSEDIDIHITPPVELEVKTGKNHNKKQHVQGRKDYYDCLANEIAIADIEGARDHAFDDERQYYSGGIRLSYDSYFDQTGAAAKEGVLLEVGFDDVAPNQPVDISSWAYDHAMKVAVDVVDNRALGVLCYLPEYTFVEKLQAISTKYRKYKEGAAFPANFMRHYYDVYCLLQSDSVLEFTCTEEYSTHKKKRFPASDIAIPVGENPAFMLADAEDYERFKKEYEAKSALYYQGQPDFDDVMNMIRKHAKSL